jgi:hypothetical protein
MAKSNYRWKLLQRLMLWPAAVFIFLVLLTYSILMSGDSGMGKALEEHAEERKLAEKVLTEKTQLLEEKRQAAPAKTAQRTEQQFPELYDSISRSISTLTNLTSDNSRCLADLIDHGPIPYHQTVLYFDRTSIIRDSSEGLEFMDGRVQPEHLENGLMIYPPKRFEDEEIGKWCQQNFFPILDQLETAVFHSNLEDYGFEDFPSRLDDVDRLFHLGAQWAIIRAFDRGDRETAMRYLHDYYRTGARLAILGNSNHDTISKIAWFSDFLSRQGWIGEEELVTVQEYAPEFWLTGDELKATAVAQIIRYGERLKRDPRALKRQSGNDFYNITGYWAADGVKGFLRPLYNKTVDRQIAAILSGDSDAMQRARNGRTVMHELMAVSAYDEFAAGEAVLITPNPDVVALMPYLDTNLIYFQANVQLAKLIIAYRRYELAKGTAPQSVEDLIPEFLEEDFADPNLVRWHIVCTGEPQLPVYGSFVRARKFALLSDLNARRTEPVPHNQEEARALFGEEVDELEPFEFITYEDRPAFICVMASTRFDYDGREESVSVYGQPSDQQLSIYRELAKQGPTRVVMFCHWNRHLHMREDQEAILRFDPRRPVKE